MSIERKLLLLDQRIRELQAELQQQPSTLSAARRAKRESALEALEDRRDELLAHI
eukprot:m.100782 g.100782  ORF g.100782 m.100782 type:complete len:55 (+) comp18687_c0_seq1:205-369(+)